MTRLFVIMFFNSTTMRPLIACSYRSPVSGSLLWPAVKHKGVLLEGVPGQAAHVTTRTGTAGATLLFPDKM